MLSIKVVYPSRNQRLSDLMQKFSQSKQVQIRALSVADPALELQGVGGVGRGVGVVVLLALAAFSSSVISSYFTQKKVGGPRIPLLDLPLVLSQLALVVLKR